MVTCVRCGGDVGEMWGRCGGDVGEKWGGDGHLREARQLVLIALATQRPLHEVLQLCLLREASGYDAAKDAEAACALELLE